MGFGDLFADIGKFIAGNSGLVSSGLEAAATVAGAAITANANSNAADKALQGQQAQVDAITRGQNQAQRRFDVIQEQTAPAVDYLRQIVNNPTSLTPQQKEDFDRVERTTLRNVNASGLRGSARGTVAAIRDTTNNFLNQAEITNRNRSDTAANTLANQNFDTASDAARTDINAGNAIGAAVGSNGTTQAALTAATGASRGAALGDLASIISTDIKGRDSRFKSPENSDPNKKKAI